MGCPDPFDPKRSHAIVRYDTSGQLDGMVIPVDLNQVVTGVEESRLSQKDFDERMSDEKINVPGTRRSVETLLHEHGAGSRRHGRSPER